MFVVWYWHGLLGCRQCPANKQYWRAKCHHWENQNVFCITPSSAGSCIHDDIADSCTTSIMSPWRPAVLRETQMIVWCVVPNSTGWMPSIATWEGMSSVVQLGSQRVEYCPMHHINLVFFLCHSFNHLWPINILNWSFCYFEKHTTWSEKRTTLP